MESRKSSKKSLNLSRQEAKKMGFRIPQWQFIRDRMPVILCFLAGVFLIVASWFGWRTYTSYKNARALTAYKKARLQSHDQVIPTLEQLTKEYPGTKASRLAWLDLGHAYYSEGQIESAIKAYERALEGFSEDRALRPIIWLSLGYCSEAKKDYTTARRYLNQAAESAKDNIKVIAYLSLGRICKKLDDSSAAVNAYRKTLSTNKGIRGPYKSMAEWEMAQLTVPEVVSDN